MTTTDARLDRILEQHAELRETVSDMKAFLHHPRPEHGTEEASVWANRLAERLLHLHQRVNRHFQEEEASGFLTDLRERFPRTARTVDRLEAEHDMIRDRVRELLDATLTYSESRPTDNPRLRRGVLTILERLARHERKETDFVQTLFLEDIGVGD